MTYLWKHLRDKEWRQASIQQRTWTRTLSSSACQGLNAANTQSITFGQLPLLVEPSDDCILVKHHESEDQGKPCQFLAHQRCEILGVYWLKLPTSALTCCTTTHNWCRASLQSQKAGVNKLEVYRWAFTASSRWDFFLCDQVWLALATNPPSCHPLWPSDIQMHPWNLSFSSITPPWPPVLSLLHGYSHPILGPHC